MKTFKMISLSLLFVLLMTACTSTIAPDGDPVLTVGDKTYTQTELEALDVTQSQFINRDGETETYTGVSLIALLEDANIYQSGKTLTFLAADGYTAEVTVDEISGCINCIVAFDNDSLRTVMPDFSGKLQVKDVVEISID